MALEVREAPNYRATLEERADYVAETIAVMTRLPWRDRGVVTIPADLDPPHALVRWHPRDDDTGVIGSWTVEIEQPFDQPEDDEHLLAHARLALLHAFERELLDMRRMAEYAASRGKGEEEFPRRFVEPAERVVAYLRRSRIEAVPA